MMDIQLASRPQPGQLLNLQTQTDGLVLLQVLVPEVSEDRAIARRGGELALLLGKYSQLTRDIVPKVEIRHVGTQNTSLAGATVLAHEAHMIVNDDGIVVKNRFGRDRVHVTALTPNEGARHASMLWSRLLARKVQTSVPG